MNVINSVVRFWLALSLFCMFSCGDKEGKQVEFQGEASKKVVQTTEAVNDSSVSPGSYKLNSPIYQDTLPEELLEVSGLSYAGKEAFYMVQDEEGIVFSWNRDSQTLAKKQYFAKPNDYEGIEVVKDQIYVVKNTGTLYYMPKSDEDSLKAIKVNTFLKGDNDIEGLGYLPEENLLLLACKEPFLEKGQTNKDIRSIYAFDVKTNTLRESAWLYLNVYQLEKEMAKLPQTEDIKKVRNLFHPEKRKSLAPSGIAVHPLTGHIYILAHRSQLLMVLSKTGKMLTVYHLDRKLFSQPEGICFKEDGELYISNEGVDGPATLLGFKFQP